MRGCMYFLAGLLMAWSASAAQAAILLEDMTWQEIAAAVKAGKTTVIVPTGGTEQNGPHIVLGKHNFILARTAPLIAARLGNALMAPVMPYVPEGDITPPTGHMRFAGTLSLRPGTFAAFLEDTARSLKRHGFTLICFVGEHGASQPVQREVADKLTAEWKGEGVRVLQVNEYYDAHNGQVEWLKAQGSKDPDPEAHAGLADTSEMLAAHPQGIRAALVAQHGPADMGTLGIGGNPLLAKRETGESLLELKVAGAVRQIREAQAAK